MHLLPLAATDNCSDAVLITFASVKGDTLYDETAYEGNYTADKLGG